MKKWWINVSRRAGGVDDGDDLFVISFMDQILLAQLALEWINHYLAKRPQTNREDGRLE